MDNVQREVHAGRLPAGSKEVRRSRAPVAARLRRNEAARSQDSAARQAAPARSRGAAGATLRRLGPAGTGGPVAKEVGGEVTGAGPLRNETGNPVIADS